MKQEKQLLQVALYKDNKVLLTTASHMVTEDMFNICDYILMDGNMYFNSEDYEEAHETLARNQQWASKGSKKIYKKGEKWDMIFKPADKEPDLERQLEKEDYFSDPLTAVEAITKAVDPDHYKAYIDDYQWIECMSKIPTMRDPVAFIGALEINVRKYLDRRGQKDKGLQELKKAQVYLSFLVSYVEHGVLNLELID